MPPVWTRAPSARLIRNWFNLPRRLPTSPAGLAQSVERETLNLKVAGSTPAFGYSYKQDLRSFFWFFFWSIMAPSEFVTECQIPPPPPTSPAGLAQSVERETLNLKVAGSTPAFGYSYKQT